MKRPLVYFGLALVFGEILGFIDLVMAWSVGLLILGVMLWTGIKRKKTVIKDRRFLLVPLFCLVGIFRVMIVEQEESDYVNQIPFIEKSVSGQVYKVENRASGGQTVYLKVEGETSFSVVIYTSGIDLYPGDVIVAVGQVQLFNKATNPGTYNAYEVNKQERLYYCMYNPDIEKIKAQSYFGFRSMVKLKGQIHQVIDQAMNPKDTGIMKGIITGDRTDMDQTLKSLYMSQGIGHIFAISGLHMSIAGIGLYSLLKKIMLPAWVSAPIAIIVMILYGGLCGFGVPVYRALIMFALRLIGECIGRTYDQASGLSLAGIYILWKYPAMIMNFGFILSFGCIIMILLSGQLIKNNGFKKRLIQGIMVYLFNMPVLAWFKYEIATYSIILNLVIIPMMSVLYPIGLLASLIGLVFQPVANVLLLGCHWVLLIYEKLTTLTSLLPLSNIVTGRPSLWVVVLVEAMLICALISWHYKIGRYLRPVGIATVGLVFFTPAPKGLTMLFVDVGQGDCCVIWSDDGSVSLVDGGSLSESDVGLYTIEQVLKFYGCGYLDRVVLTHLDTDHISGVMYLLENQFPIGQIFISSMTMGGDKLDFIRGNAKVMEIPISYLSQGMAMSWGSLDVSCLSPNSYASFSSENETSIVLKMDYGSRHFLMTGDVEGIAEKNISQQLGNQSEMDVLKVAHHGSRNSTSSDFLATTKPKVAVISCGRNNMYGHPHEDTLNRLKAIGSQIYCTKDTGAIRVYTDGEQLRVSGYMGDEG